MSKRVAHYTKHIHAPREQVCQLMLAPDTYQQWTAEFCEGSAYVGSWEDGENIRFVGPSGDGMYAVIAENRLPEYISIKHLGVIANGQVDTESEKVKAWAPAFENYTFKEVDGGTTVEVAMDILPEYEAMFNELWPKALDALAKLCEGKQ